MSSSTPDSHGKILTPSVLGGEASGRGGGHEGGASTGGISALIRMSPQSCVAHHVRAQGEDGRL